MKTWLSIRWFLLLLAASLLTACGEEPEDTTDSVLPNRPDDKLIEDTGRPDRIVNDPTPQAGTSGEIPGYTPLDPEEEDEEAEPSRSD